MKTMIRNPFITSGRVSADYFCDRHQESERLVREVMNGNSLALVSTRRTLFRYLVERKLLCEILVSRVSMAICLSLSRRCFPINRVNN